jgi:hypothetical protein
MSIAVQKLWWAASAAALGVALGGCSDSNDSSAPSASHSETQQGRAATQICGRLFGDEGSSALEKLTRSRHFAAPATSGSIETRSLVQAAEQLRSEAPVERSGERIYLCLPEPSDAHTVGTLQVSTQWLHLRSGDYTWASTDGHFVFDLTGKRDKSASAPYASATEESAWLGFNCPVGPGTSDDTVLTVDVQTSLLDSYRNSEKPALLTHLAHDTAVKVAKKAGCFAQSQLPEDVATLTPLPSAG